MKDFLELQDKRLELPAFIPSISGSSLPEENLRNLRPFMIEAIGNPRTRSVMVSAYDLMYHDRLFSDIGEMIGRGSSIHEAFGLPSRCVAYIDSGGYEWAKGAEQPDDPLEIYAFEIIARSDVAVILDCPTLRTLSHEKNNSRISKTIEFASKVKEHYDGKARLMAVAHGYDESSLLRCASQLASMDGIRIIAIPAREPFGLAIERRLVTLQRISELIASTDPEKIVHILAMGRMRLLPFYVMCGASSFDATDWIAYTADPVGLRWVRHHNEAQADLSKKCQCEWCKSLGSRTISETCGKGPSSRMNHNRCSLDLMMENIRNHIKRKTLHEYCQQTNPELFRKLTKMQDASKARKR